MKSWVINKMLVITQIYSPPSKAPGAEDTHPKTRAESASSLLVLNWCLMNGWEVESKDSLTFPHLIYLCLSHGYRILPLNYIMNHQVKHTVDSNQGQTFSQWKMSNALSNLAIRETCKIFCNDWKPFDLMLLVWWDGCHQASILIWLVFQIYDLYFSHSDFNYFNSTITIKKI